MKITATAALAAAALTLLAGCGDSGGSDAASTPAAGSASPAASASASPSAEATKASDPSAVDALDAAGLKDTDLLDSRFSGDATVSDEPRFAGEGPTFDYCGGSEPSVGQRVARSARGVNGTIGGKPVQLVEEVVQYADPSAARSALTEFKAAVASCDGGSHDTFLSKDGPLRFSPGEQQSDTDGLPTPNYLEVSELSGEGGSGYLATLVVQQDKYLTIGYVVSQHQPGTNEGFTLGYVTKAVAKRVGSLPS